MYSCLIGSAALTIALKDDIEVVQKTKNEVEIWKRKTGTLTDICERTSSKIDDLETRMDNIELSASKKNYFEYGTKRSSKKRTQLLHNGFLKKGAGTENAG